MEDISRETEDVSLKCIFIIKTLLIFDNWGLSSIQDPGRKGW